MRVAVPLLGEDVAPRFGFADNFLTAEIEGDQIVAYKHITTRTKGWVKRLEELRQIDVEVLLCGGFNRLFIPLARSLGMEVVAGLYGNARALIIAFVNGEELPAFVCDEMGDVPGMEQDSLFCRQPGRGRGRAKRAGQGHRGRCTNRQGRKNQRSQRRKQGKAPETQGE